MKKAIFFLALFLLAFSIVEAYVVDNDHSPTIQVDFKEEVSLVNYSLQNIAGASYDISIRNENNETFYFTPVDYLPNGDYVFTIAAADKVGNEVVSTKNFTVDVPFTEITLVEPEYGISPSDNFDLTVKTADPVRGCGYSAQDPYSPQGCFYDKYWKIPSELRFEKLSDNKTFRITGFKIGYEDEVLPICVLCEDAEGISGTKNFELMVDTTPPDITAYSDPAKVIEYIEVSLVAESNPNAAGKKDLINCRYDTVPGRDYESMIYKFQQDDITFGETDRVALTGTTTPKIADKDRKSGV